MRRESGADLRAVHELAEDDIEVLQARVAECLQVPCAAVSEMIRRLVEVSLVHLDGRIVSLASAGGEAGTAVVPQHRLAERFLTDVLEMKSGAATCPYADAVPRSGYGDGRMLALSEVPVGERVHVEHIPERPEVIAGLVDQLERDGLVRGLTVSVANRRADNATMVRTGRGDIWVDAGICDRLLVTLGDIDRVTDELRCRSAASSAHTTPTWGRRSDAR